jgi:hypothetical protein
MAKPRSLPDMTAVEARETWIRESMAVSRLAGDDPRTRPELLAEWKELTHGRQLAFRIEQAVQAGRARAILETIGGYADGPPED